MTLSVAPPTPPIEDEQLPPPAVRPPYLLTDLSRPLWRGRLMGWLHSTRTWYVVAAAYVAAVCLLPARVPLSPRGVLLRVLAAAASSANVLISDGYHNPDRRVGVRGAAAYTASAELSWLRLDYVGISSVLTTLLWLWSANLGSPGLMPLVSIASGVATALVALLSALWVPAKAGHNTVKGIMAFQFVGLLGYLVFGALNLAPAACQVNKLIFLIYAPGLFLYVLKKPKSPVFGFHEYFHASVIAGHVASMAFDLRNVLRPCAACVGL